MVSASGDADEDQPLFAAVLDAVRFSGRRNQDGPRSDRSFLLFTFEKKALSLENHPDMVACMHVGMNVLARLQAPQGRARMGRLAEDDLLRLLDR